MDELNLDRYAYGFHDEDTSVYKSAKGLRRETIEEISKIKQENEWMRDFRLKAFETFSNMPMPNWGPSLESIDFDDYTYYVKPSEKTYDELKVLNFGENFETLDGEYPYRNLRGDDIPENLKVVLLEDVLNYLQANGDFTYIIEIKDKGENGFKAADELYIDYDFNNGLTGFMGMPQTHVIALSYYFTKLN